jgi:hypothetical protein
MRLGCPGVVRFVPAALVVILFVSTPSAEGASTRAEYVAQVDPVCQSFVGPVNDAKTAYKRWVRDLSKGTLHNWVRQTARTAISLRRLNHVHAGLTDQIAAIPPFSEDAATLATWLNDRRQVEAFADSAALAFGLFKFDRFRAQLRQAGVAEEAGIRAVSGFGFQVCGVTV